MYAKKNYFIAMKLMVLISYSVRFFVLKVCGSLYTLTGWIGSQSGRIRQDGR